MNIFSTFFAVAVCCFAVEIQTITSKIIVKGIQVRLAVEASKERCPLIQVSEKCKIKVFAKRESTWDACDAESPPSGADLPMHRWFKVIGHCTFRLHGITLSLPLPKQVIFR
jgi:hypothetical protein